MDELDERGKILREALISDDKRPLLKGDPLLSTVAPPVQSLDEFLPFDTTSALNEDPDKEGTLRILEVQTGSLSWYKCGSCPFLASTKERVSTHFSLVHLPSPSVSLKCISCEDVGPTYTRLAALRSHYVTEHYVSCDDLAEVMRITTVLNKQWRCRPVSGSFSPEPEVDLPPPPPPPPLPSHDDPIQALLSFKALKSTAPFPCSLPFCTLKFITKAALSIHQSCHQPNSSTWKCSQCSSIFAKWTQLSLHLWRVHSIDTELYSCDLCPFKTHSLSKLLNLHRRIHYEERPFLCDTCGKGFKNPKQLSNHRSWSHRRQDAEPVGVEKCHICSRVFTEKKLLKGHIQVVHLKWKPYICAVCGYATGSRSSLKSHSRCHTGEKPYACPDCSYTTSDHNSLRKHKMRHSGAKSYACPLCSYSSIQASTFKDHLLSKHPQSAAPLLYKCTSCSYTTVSRDNYLAHASKHNEDDEKLTEFVDSFDAMEEIKF